MTVIDIVIIGSITYIYILFYRHRKTATILRLRASIINILLGLFIIQIFYAIDLFSMIVLPLFISMEKSMAVMKQLHLNWRWITSLMGILFICFGLLKMIPKISFNVQKIRKISQEVEIKNRDLEETLGKLKNTQLQLIQNEKMAALGNLVAGVAHEINNPVGFMSGNINAARDHIQDLLSALYLYRQEYPDPRPEIVEKLEELDIDFIAEDFPKIITSMGVGVERIAKISKSLRIFSRLDADAKITCNLNEGIDNALLILKYRLKANEKRPPISILKDYESLPLIYCYPGQLNQVFINILANAIDALEESNQEKTFQEIKNAPNRILISTQLSKDRKSAVVQIADNGMGMPEELKARIFEQGFTTKGVGKGTGLGMAIARQIVVEKHGGTISVNSEIGVGTEFIIILPV
ncbi:MAG: ATP-binding protein [Microcoleaceae cyanobacterium]